MSPNAWRSNSTELGQGEFLTLVINGGVGWRYHQEPWLARLGLRAGSMMVAGKGYLANDRVWLPWAELVVGGGRRVGPVVIVVTAGFSPFRHKAVTVGKTASAEISNLRLGVGLELPIVSTEF